MNSEIKNSPTTEKSVVEGGIVLAKGTEDRGDVELGEPNKADTSDKVKRKRRQKSVLQKNLTGHMIVREAPHAEHYRKLAGNRSSTRAISTA